MVLEDVDEDGKVQDAVDELSHVPPRRALHRRRELRHDEVRVRAGKVDERDVFDVGEDVLLEALDVVLDGRLGLDVVGVQSREIAAGPALGERAERDRAPLPFRGRQAIEVAGGDRADLLSEAGQRRRVGGRPQLHDLLDEGDLARGAQTAHEYLDDACALLRGRERRAPGQELRAALLWRDGDAHEELAALLVRAAGGLSELHG
ncbi:MAG TPA: hypothetical protein VK841_10050 [Polyangiaceae bacterium]|nr:hypothetical protein [Polyangiaceae bacterium]